MDIFYFMGNSSNELLNIKFCRYFLVDIKRISQVAEDDTLSQKPYIPQNVHPATSCEVRFLTFAS